ncbi:protein kinase [bacterium]|nr:protein kinase [bacterium]
MSGLSVTFSAGTGQRAFTLERGGSTVTVGRSQDAELFVNSPRLSRRHCEVKLGEQGVEVQDLGSANGTFLNGQRVDRALVQPGDVVQVGGIAIRIDYVPPEGMAGPADMRCAQCGRAISMQTVEDGHVFDLGEKPLCPACSASARLSQATDAERRVIQRLAEEGYSVLAKTPLSTALIPVFKAKRTGLENVVAIKALPLVSGVPKKKIERFLTEAKAGAKIKHPNVVQVYDIRRLPDLLYIVMEYVEGETLLAKIERGGKMQQREVLRIGLLLAKALEAAQKQGIIHRDIKPANIILTAEDGTPKIVDFGLAKDLWQITGGLTGPEETLGTVRYMPPEQVKNAREADHRADIYAVGATLFHALTGKPPYPDRGEVDLLRHVVAGTLPPFDPRGADIPSSVADVLARATQRSPADRYATAAEFREALAGAVASMAGVPSFKGDPELLLSLRQPLDATWVGGMPKAPKPGGMAGAFEGDQLVEFVQMLGLNSKTGVLEVNATKTTGGHLGFKEGKIIAARTRSGQKGQDAAWEILALKKGEFEFRPELPASVKKEHAFDVQSLLLEALRRRDDESRGVP